MVRVSSFLCNRRPKIVQPTLPPKPDRSEMPIFSIGRSGSGTGALLSTVKPAFQKPDIAYVGLYFISIYAKKDSDPEHSGTS